ncbi:hypothetical protein CFP56_014460 [Quercus suber]|uniref:Uncharacterized protein n=1 Tax=Quercus suber TaxID=58331 RepID=A0AAW0M311_QUESU
MFCCRLHAETTLIHGIFVLNILSVPHPIISTVIRQDHSSKLRHIEHNLVLCSSLYFAILIDVLAENAVPLLCLRMSCAIDRHCHATYKEERWKTLKKQLLNKRNPIKVQPSANLRTGRQDLTEVEKLGQLIDSLSQSLTSLEQLLKKRKGKYTRVEY